MGPHYCTYWYCSQKEIEISYATGGIGENAGDTVQNVNRDTEHTDCVCQYESTSGKYCYQWWCYETGKDGNTETEQYTCTEASFDETYCNRWQGRIISADEKEWSTCKCSRPSNDGYCTYWTCFEKEHKRTYAVNFGWAVAIAGLALIIFAIAGLCVFPGNASKLRYNITWAVICGIFIMGFCTLAAGVLGLLMGAGVVLIIIITLVIVYFNCGKDSIHQDKPQPQVAMAYPVKQDQQAQVPYQQQLDPTQQQFYPQEQYRYHYSTTVQQGPISGPSAPPQQQQYPAPQYPDKKGWSYDY
eukprot:TRINITY_DN338_c0_g1_i13.p1 TRINITY_DN338_c0_g1~~TRINITY_DN338_c0_g1_i13.p1  ORF type:complete len:300 (+),score=7.26 TRINITY_DN338_c0_g1_i13:203-1102(+)